MKYTLAILALLLIGSGCTKLDEEIYDKIPEDRFPENAQQAALAAVPTYKELGDLIDDGGWWFWAQEISSDEIVFPVRDTDWRDGDKWIDLHQHDWSNDMDAVNTMWSALNEGITEANRALDDLGPNGPPSKLAELKALRALYLYLLMDNYGDVPYITTFYTAPNQPTKATRTEIYEGLTAELTAIASDLDVNRSNISVSRGMVFTLLAKLHLNAQVYTGTPQWGLAEAYCDSVLLSGAYSLDADALGPFKAQNTGNLENIFAIPFDEIALEGLRFHRRTLHYLNQQTFDMPVDTWNGFGAVEDHFNSFSDDDARKAGFIVGQQFDANGAPLEDEVTEGPLVITPEIPALEMTAGVHSPEEIRHSAARIGKFEIETGAMENMNNDFPLFRLADVHLMRAEARIRSGASGDEDVNIVRNRAGLDNWSGTTLDMILEERGREMFMEGHRRQDLIRFGRFGDSWWEKGPSGPERETFPIPQWAVDLNPNLN